MKILILLFLLTTSAHAGIQFFGDQAMSSYDVVFSDETKLFKDNRALKSNMAVCTTVVVKGRGMTHLLPISQYDMRNHLKVLLGWINPNDEVVVITSSKDNGSSYDNEEDIIKGFLNHIQGVNNVIIYDHGIDKTKLGRSVIAYPDGRMDVIDINKDQVGSTVYASSEPII